jgi:hypothetical protein
MQRLQAIEGAVKKKRGEAPAECSGALVSFTRRQAAVNL